jgi:hypothetical protein
VTSAHGDVRASRRWKRLLPVSVLVAAVAAAVATAVALPAHGAAAHGAAAPAGNSDPAPAQMKELDFILGSYRCVVTNTVPGQPVSQDVFEYVATPVLGGHWYEMDGEQLPSKSLPETIHFRWVYGWNPVTSTFTEYYYDDHSGEAVQTSPGWKDGTIDFTGPYYLYGGTVTFRDVYTVVSQNEYRDSSSIQQGTRWVHATTNVCTRT